MSRNILRFCSLALLALMTACGSVFEQPQVNLRSVQLGGLGLRGGTLLVNLEITNPNSFTLSANQLEYKLAIANTEVTNDTTWLDLATGLYTEPFSVGGGATENVQIPVEFTYSSLSGAATSILRAGTFSYRATGTVEVRTPLGTRDVPFRKGGMVSLLGGAN